MVILFDLIILSCDKLNYSMSAIDGRQVVMEYTNLLDKEASSGSDSENMSPNPEDESSSKLQKNVSVKSVGVIIAQKYCCLHCQVSYKPRKIFYAQ